MMRTQVVSFLLAATVATAASPPLDGGVRAGVPPSITMYLPAERKSDLPVHRYAYHRLGQPAFQCRDAYPCLTFFDGLFTLTGNLWTHHYVIDVGVPTAPAVVGARDQQEIEKRVEETLRALLVDEKVTAAKGDCWFAAALPQMVDVVTPLEVAVESSGARARPLTAMTVDAAEVAWRKEAERHQSKEPIEPLFLPSERAQMKSASFGPPRLRSKHRSPDVIGDRFRLAHFVVLFSPRSRFVYVLDRSRDEGLEGSIADIPEQARQRDAKQLSAITATLLELGIKTFTLEREQLCELAALTPNEGWFGVKVPPALE